MNKMNREKDSQALAWYWRTDTRYYALKIERDLLGDWVVMQRWGSRFNRRGGNKTIAFHSLDEALVYRKRRYLGRYFAHPMMQNRRAKRDDYKPSAVRVTQRYVP
ncbi:hypothetical protein Psal006b_03577 (plasmid) [Piscirickettsia salmonis]|uniref:Transposase n=2 Tax=Piscirickettsia salmonis TaxID=1238 RepID=A0A1L6TI81_PISSA|nr:WGR domain-containing protein [Piscirickettsia salmonis]ALB24403.1 transposase [Piscirickettsia salmonis]ALY04372.1 hypothetical protein AWE47_17570 [Piscirickettsia salmonis]AMA44060.1 hypothetical protein AWJ11_16915 [Piscirickettsia salmonis]AOS36834.1 hypothetical protein AVM72_15765 [Piscirickettsia salmonis]APS62284.1 hypothetical protein AVI53_17165 [Piscirickettsia salmonis]